MMNKRYTVEESIRGKCKPAIRIEDRYRGEYMRQPCPDETLYFGPVADKLYAYEELGYSPDGLKLMISELEYLRKERFAKPVSGDASINTENNQFTKADLKVGYVVKTRARGLYMVTRNDIDQLVMVDQYYGHMPLSEYNDDLTDSDRTSCLSSEADENYDIVEVYGYSAINGRTHEIETEHRKLLWKREGPREMTLEEVEKALGYPVKIVNK